MKYVRENIEREFDQIFNKAERMAIKHGVQPTLPCRVKRQIIEIVPPPENEKSAIPNYILKKYFERSLANPNIGQLHI